MPRILARVGEQFQFRVVLDLPFDSTVPLEIKMAGGRRLPRFVRADLAAVAQANAEKRGVELGGVPAKGDIGVYDIGVYKQGAKECVGRVVVEVGEVKR